MEKGVLKTALRDTVPVLTGYLVLGMGFGIIMNTSGYGIILPVVMSLFVVYCLKGVTFSSPGGWLPSLIAGAVVVISYLIKKNTLISIVGGTLCYMLLVQLVF